MINAFILVNYKIMKRILKQTNTRTLFYINIEVGNEFDSFEDLKIKMFYHFQTLYCNLLSIITY